MASESIDLQQAWRDACKEFSDATGLDLDVPSPTAEEIVVKLDGLKEAKDAKSKQVVAKAKRAVGLTLKAVERIGSIVVQGASMAGFGGPANITLNCISFFIDAGFAYEKIADNIDDLFGRIGPIMERSQLYKDNQDVIGPEMSRVAHRLLIAVVKTCEKCIGILRPPHSKRAKIKLFFEVALFSSDGGVQAQLSLLESLQDQEGRMGGALTLITTKVIAKDLAEGLKEQKALRTKMEDTTKDDKMLSELKDKLSINEITTTANSTDFSNRREKLTPGSCGWLKTDAEYGAWSDTSKESKPVMILRGDEGCGKSYSITAVIRDLMERYPQGGEGETRVSVAYFYLTRSDKTVAPSILNVLRQWAGQIMKNDLIYRKDISTVVKRGAPDTVEEALHKLFLDHLSKEAKFFLILDGTHELEERGTRELSELVQGLAGENVNLSSLRIMFTATPSLYTEMVHHRSSTVASLDLRVMNQADMKEYVVNGVNSLAIFKNTSQQVVELKEQVITELSETAKGDFFVASRTLSDIGNSADAEEIRAILARAREGEVLSASVEKEISNCNRTLSNKEITHLNCLLLWVIFGRWTFQMYDLESILFVQEQRQSLQPIHKQIKDKYSAFFDINEQTDMKYASVTLKYSSIEDYFQEKSKQRMTSTSGLSDALTKGEIMMAKHFIEKLCDEQVYQRLGLAEFFDQQLSKSDTGVSLEWYNAEARIALGCMQALTGASTPESEALEFYAKQYLSSHLGAMDLETVDAHIKAKLGPLIVKLFTDPVPIEKCGWAGDDDGVKRVVQLLRNSAVRKGIANTDAKGDEWVCTVLDSDKIPAEVALLKDSLAVKERLWLTEENTMSVMDHFRWLFAYHNKVESIDNKVERNIELDENETGTEVIEDILKRVPSQDTNGTEDDKAEATKLRNIGVTYFRCKHVPEAIRYLEDALTHNADEMLIHNELANAYANDDDVEGIEPDWEKALLHKNFVVDGLKAGRRLLSDTEPLENWRYIATTKAKWLRKLLRYDESQEVFEEVLEKFPDDDNVRLEFVNTLYEAGRYGAIVEMFQDLKSKTDEETKRTHLSRFFYSNAWDQECHGNMVGAFVQADRMVEINEHYRQAIKDSSEDSDEHAKNVCCYLIYYHASMLNRVGQTTEQKSEAVSLWESVVERARSEDNIWYAHVLSAKQLARVYIIKAIEAGKDSDQAGVMLDKIRGFSEDISVETEDESSTGKFGLSRSVVRSLLGRYHRAVGDDESAKAQLRPEVKVAFQLLSDDDPDNDWQGYRKLGDALMNFGDFEDAVAAWSLIQPTQGGQLFGFRSSSPKTTPSEEPDQAESNGASEALEETEAPEGKDAQPEPRPSLKRSNTSAKLKGPLTYSCDGRCGTEWTYTDDFYVCRECIDVQFNKECLDKLRSGKLSRDICNPAHEFMHVPEWTSASLDRTRNERVLVGEQEMVISEWLDGIKLKWGIPTVEAEPATPTVAVAA